jgi:hypothetical protein
MVTAGIHLPRGVWRVSPEEQKAARDKILSEYADAAMILAIRQDEAIQLSKEILGLSELLKPEHIWNISLESYKPLLSQETYQKIALLKAAIPAAQNEVAQLSDKMRQFGLGHMLGPNK